MIEVVAWFVIEVMLATGGIGAALFGIMVTTYTLSKVGMYMFTDLAKHYSRVREELAI